MHKDDMAKLMDHIFDECRGTRKEGQKEYAHDDGDAFANFNEDAKELGLHRLQTWAVFFNKHRRGLLAYIKGHRSQREDVRGRIKDMIVYLCLVWGMIDEEEELEKNRIAPMPPMPQPGEGFTDYSNRVDRIAREPRRSDTRHG